VGGECQRNRRRRGRRQGQGKAQATSKLGSRKSARRGGVLSVRKVRPKAEEEPGAEGAAGEGGTDEAREGREAEEDLAEEVVAEAGYGGGRSGRRRQLAA
jgi:hypothetical protein